MNPKHYHTPSSTRALCPVCKRGVYSPAGIHPQCAMVQSDPLRKVAKAGQFVPKIVAADAPAADAP